MEATISSMFLSIAIPICLIAAATISYLIWHNDLKEEDEELVAKIDGWFVKLWRSKR